jgi:hypothetical protein
MALISELIHTKEHQFHFNLVQINFSLIWQVVTWLVVPKLLKEEQVKLIMTILLVTYLLQFIPKLYHAIYLLKKMQKVTGYIFGSVWSRFSLSLFAYYIASHVSLVIAKFILLY